MPDTGFWTHVEPAPYRTICNPLAMKFPPSGATLAQAEDEPANNPGASNCTGKGAGASAANIGPAGGNALVVALVDKFETPVSLRVRTCRAASSWSGVPITPASMAAPPAGPTDAAAEVVANDATSGALGSVESRLPFAPPQAASTTAVKSVRLMVGRERESARFCDMFKPLLMRSCKH